MIYKTQFCIKELPLDMPDVDFQSCYSKVQQEYNIQENLIIVVVYKKELSNLSFLITNKKFILYLIIIYL